MNHTLTEFREGIRVADLRQEGTVFRWAVWDMAKVAKQALDAAGVTSADLAAFIPTRPTCASSTSSRSS